MKKSISVTELARNLAEYINRVVYRGDSFVIYRSSKAVAEIVPAKGSLKLGGLEELLNSFPVLSAKEQDDFARDVLALRRESVGPEVKDPWDT